MKIFYSNIHTSILGIILTIKQNRNDATIILSPLVACTFKIIKSYTVIDTKRTKPKRWDQMLIVSFVHQNMLKINKNILNNLEILDS